MCKKSPQPSHSKVELELPAGRGCFARLTLQLQVLTLDKITLGLGFVSPTAVRNDNEKAGMELLPFLPHQHPAASAST